MTNTLESILKGLANNLAGLGFISKAGGLLQETTISTSGGNSVRTSAQVSPFSTGRLVDVCPDKNETCVTFFQAGATRVTRQDMYIMQLENEITLTGWINGNRIGIEPMQDPELQIIGAIRKARFAAEEGSPLRCIEIDFTADGEPLNVSRWGWDKPEFQYGGHPHRLFQHKFKVSYILATGCASQSVHVLNPAC
jgi:hypothetical protein